MTLVIIEHKGTNKENRSGSLLQLSIPRIVGIRFIQGNGNKRIPFYAW